MKQKTDKIAEALELETVTDIVASKKELAVSQPVPPQPEPVTENTENSPNELNQDLEFARRKVKKFLNDTEIALEGILQIAAEGESARAYEVAGQLIKNGVDATSSLMQLHKTTKETEKVAEKTGGNDGTGSGGTKNVTNNSIFLGSTKELLELINKNKNNVEEIPQILEKKVVKNEATT